MLNGPNACQSFCDRLGIQERDRSRLYWASLASVPLLWWVFSGRSQPKSSPDTNINAFLKNKTPSQIPAGQQAKRKATSFHSFLKEVPQAHRDASSFSAFLKTPGSNHAVAASNAPKQKADQGPRAADAVITVLFGTEYGFSKEVAERAADAIKASGSYWCAALRVLSNTLLAQRETAKASCNGCLVQGEIDGHG